MPTISLVVKLTILIKSKQDIQNNWIKEKRANLKIWKNNSIL